MAYTFVLYCVQTRCTVLELDVDIIEFCRTSLDRDISLIQLVIVPDPPTGIRGKTKSFMQRCKEHWRGEQGNIK